MFSWEIDQIQVGLSTSKEEEHARDPQGRMAKGFVENVKTGSIPNQWYRISVHHYWEVCWFHQTNGTVWGWEWRREEEPFRSQWGS